MPQPEISNAATIIQFLVAGIFFCLGLVNLAYGFILRRIKKDSDDLRTEIRENRKRCDEDHDEITRLKERHDNE